MAEHRIQTYVAAKEFVVGNRIVRPGDPVPEAEGWRRPQSWVNSGHLTVAYRDMTAKEVAARQSAITAEDRGPAGDLADLSGEDLKELALVHGLDVADVPADELDRDTVIADILNPPTRDDRAVLAEMNVPDLRAHAKAKGLTGFSKLVKDDLIDLIAGG